MTVRSIARCFAYLWASPYTLVALAVIPVAVLTGGGVRLRAGCIEVHGGTVAWALRRIGAAALTLGHVIFGRDRSCLDRSRSHEHVHVGQFERWGPLTMPAYFLAGFLAWRQGLDAYLDNPFEREAFDRTDS